ncbi:PQQ-dependent sugar dehydrogenase [Dichotomicrobium thermohalophilum]|uniref:Glucose/sorbosone dehydrogenase n=1 Tax=Dichotomicrobium thermohalophilum TaxID=933063 RepID=A0A397P7B1_9HYPH|nr:PQQ-dependent sugar dehydrogenase [Dichotomicrobium thermohalophilum]RIA45430.1 glucose/sorbosone dehydrogenase [Dichotomicrobium thermohalophilum]
MNLKSIISSCLSFIVAAVLAAGTATAQEKIKLEPFVEGLNQPVAMVQTPDGRMFVAEQWGRVRVVTADGQLLGEPLLDIRHLIVDQIPDFDERGLIGLALHPDFENNGKFYVAYSGHKDWQGRLNELLWYDHNNVVAEYTISDENENLADRFSGRVLSSIAWPQFNHNGHWMDFGPDGMLYVSVGDGGYANDWGIGHNVRTGNGQDVTTVLGSIMRLDPETGEAAEGNPDLGPDADPRIWAYGLRNAWRCSFDMGGDNELFCADVGQNSYEEVNIVEAGDNLGWRRMEASHCFNYLEPDNHPEECDTSGLKMPIIEYENCTARPQNCKGISITGGYVYRGSHEPWQGKYIFGDWSKQFGAYDGQIFFGTEGEDGNWTMETAEVTNMDGNIPYVLSFAQDNDGEVYALTSVTTGPAGGAQDTIYKIVPSE